MKFSLYFLILLFSFNIFAHEDTPITLDSSGTLIGLPKQYGQAHFDKTTFTLRIGNKKISLPECLKEKFNEYPHYEFTFSASWYHEIDLLPNYINLKMISIKEDYGHEVLFNLETLDIIKIESGTAIKTKLETILYRP
jgi:hypothetical protein